VYGVGCFRHVTEDTDTRVHSTQKPVDLMSHVIEVATPKGCTVLDPFMGSGTTGVACIQTGRRFIGFELDKTYCEIATKRIAEVGPLFRAAVGGVA
jgi:DNA modification methylase